MTRARASTATGPLQPWWVPPLAIPDFVRLRTIGAICESHLFDQYQGAHLTVFFQRSLVTPEQLLATTQLPEVTASAGPWQTMTVPVEYGAQKTFVQIIARPDPGGPVDRLPLTAGRWAAQPGEIVLTHSFAQSIGVSIGGHLTALSSADRPDLVVVGEVADIDEGSASLFSQFAWVQPSG